MPSPILAKTVRKLQPKRTLRGAITAFKAGTKGVLGKFADDAYESGFMDELEKIAIIKGNIAASRAAKALSSTMKRVPKKAKRISFLGSLKQALTGSQAPQARYIKPSQIRLVGQPGARVYAM